MPQPGVESDDTETQQQSRIVSGPDPDRFYCPRPGCNRSFAELWRLKVHFRAPPDVRGSGKERGHGTELAFCPKCGKELKPGKHHVGCSAGKSAPRQAAKRQRQMSSAESDAWQSGSATSDRASDGSWEDAVRRGAARAQRGTRTAGGPAAQQDVESSVAARRPRRGAAAEPCRLGRLQEQLEAGDLVFTARAGAPDFGVLAAGSSPPDGAAPTGEAEADAGASFVYAPQPRQHAQQAAGGLLDGPQSSFGLGGGSGDDDTRGDAASLLRIPSPPPLPPEWELADARPAMLFDFDQFDPHGRQRYQAAGLSAPLVTVTTSMPPGDVANPSDDYIWQILFSGEEDAVPKRMTSHLHHHPPLPTNDSLLYDDDPLLDAILGIDPGLGAPGSAPASAPASGAAAAAEPAQWQMAPPPPRPAAPAGGAPAAAAAEPAAAEAGEQPAAAAHIMLPVPSLPPGPGGQQPRTLTVTYVLGADPLGHPAYSVASVDHQPVAGGGGGAPVVAARE